MIGSNAPAPAARTCIPAILAATLLCGPLAVADDALDLYAGGAVGQSQVHIDSEGLANKNFSKDHSSLQLMAGIRSMSFLGAEIQYVDFGHPNSRLNGAPADATLKGAAAFGAIYLPVPLIDLYAKAGVARMQSKLNGQSEVQPYCVPCSPTLFRLAHTETGFAAGAGAQFKYGALAMRVEYEYFNTGNAHPTLLSLGLTWTFF